VVARAGGDGGVLLEDLADPLEGAGGCVGDRIGYGVVGAAPPAFGPHEIIFSVAAEHPWSFDIAFWRDLFEHRPVGEGLEAGEAGFQPGDIAVAPSSIDDIVLTVLVVEDRLVDGLGAVVEFVDEGMTQVIFIGSFGFVGDGDADAADGAVVLDIVCAEEEKVFDCTGWGGLGSDGGGPHGAAGPMDGGRVEDVGVFCPVDEVGGGEGIEEDLFIVFIGVGGIDPVGVAEDGGFGVGVPAGEDGVAGGLGGSGLGGRGWYGGGWYGGSGLGAGSLGGGSWCGRGALGGCRGDGYDDDKE